MRKVLTSVALSGVAGLWLCAPMVASAQSDTSNPGGFYVGAGIGQFNLRLKNLDDTDEAIESVRDSDDNAWKGFVGYRFLPWLSIEAAYIDFGGPGESVESSGSGGNYQVDLSGFAPSLRASLPLGPVELFGKVGQYYYDVRTRVDFDDPGPDIDTEHSRNDFLWGGGVSVVVLERLALSAEYEKVEIEGARDSDAFWLTGAWRF